MAHAQKPDFVFRAKRTSPFKSAGGASVQSNTGSRGVRISGSNAGYTMFRGSVKSTGYPLHSTVSPSLSLPRVTMCHHISTEVSLQLMVKRPPDGPQISLPPTLGSAISHKHRQHHKLPQTDLPSTPRRRRRKINLTLLFMYTANITVKHIVKLCKYPVVYLDGKKRVQNNKSKFKKKSPCRSAATHILSP